MTAKQPRDVAAQDFCVGNHDEILARLEARGLVVARLHAVRIGVLAPSTSPASATTFLRVSRRVWWKTGKRIAAGVVNVQLGRRAKSAAPAKPFRVVDAWQRRPHVAHTGGVGGASSIDWRNNREAGSLENLEIGDFR